ncbi:hypothetical protein OG792_19800 [Micromonospora sp. NBC_01699]|uniref:hypothetical protein n=1 Tax=Micromonospora sp. NBC_01699 TaxID=2975984 RepID=UPI002E293266|nr:hypothetical protein [Micromonospora sp. NBC_01699]
MTIDWRRRFGIDVFVSKAPATLRPVDLRLVGPQFCGQVGENFQTHDPDYSVSDLGLRGGRPGQEGKSQT